ncbi:diguanylate cyclase domain-containing protein [Chloroflexota bacterium]
MLAITSPTVVQITAIAINIILITLVFSYGKTKYNNVFILFLTISLFWSVGILMTSMALPFEQATLWGKATPIFALGTAVSYAYYIAVVTSYSKNARIIALGGTASLTLMLVLTILGYIPKMFNFLGSGIVTNEYGEWHSFVTFCSVIFFSNAIYLLWKRRGNTANPEERNRIAYLFLGMSFIITFGIILRMIPVQNFAVNNIGHTINAIVLTYVVIRKPLVDIKLAIKNGIVIAGVAFLLFDIFLILLNNLNPLFQIYLTRGQYLAIILALALALALVFNPLCRLLRENTDRILYGKRYDYRQIVLTFADTMNHVSEMPELARIMLKPMTIALNSSQISLLLEADGYYQTCYAERQDPEEPVVSMSFRTDGPIVGWLEHRNTPLYRETITSLPEFEGLWIEERKFLESANIDLLHPIKTKQKLVAILALSQKPCGCYTQDDITLIRTMSREAAVVIENTLLYSEARERANTDELTGLFNHRYFHECLDQEISRSLRFGSIFSLISLDIDNFKKYNDINGHLAGDNVLRQTGKLFQRVLRNVDMAFRYGGDEFSILLPETPVQGAKKLGEILRLEIETLTNTQGMPVNCSFGIGSWPADGMTREDLILSADAALYYAKRNGKNRVSLASEVTTTDILTTNSQTMLKSMKPNLDAIYALAATVDAKDSYTYGHSKKVSKHAAHIGGIIGYSPESIERIRTAGLLHDIGKIGIADNILNKPGYLSPEDFEPIKAHPDKGVAILKNVDSLKDCLPGVHYHHERYDGTGYPAGLKGEDIPLDARILAVVDSYDAMTSRRSYRQLKASQEQAIEELQRCMGTQFDPKIVHVFVNLLKNETQSSKPLVEIKV